MYKKILNIINTDITLNKNLKILLSIFAILFSNVPLYIYLFSIDIIESETLLLFIIKGYPFLFFYLFCFSILFHTDVLRIKIILMSFLSFLLISLLLFSFHFIFNYVAMPPYDSEDFYIIINNLVFVPFIFFIIMIISYINFNLKDTQNIAEFFTMVGETLSWLFIINTASSVLISIAYFSIFIVGASLASLIYSYDEAGFIFAKIAISLIIFLYSLSLFVSYFLYKKTKSIISIYLSRMIMIFSLIIIFIFFILLLSAELRPYTNTVSFVVYNIALSLMMINLFFTRLDKKATILTKIIYCLSVISISLLDLIVFSSVLYRIIAYGFSMSKFILLINCILFLAHLIYIAINVVKTFKISFEECIVMKDICIDNTKNMIFIYVYLVWFLIICFVLPFFFANM
ncbi:hypothetical protein R4I97_03070 [Brachyspira pilosicoli]|uniref:hypothetical protein n=1 Tax=Brachyspira pilosicoli TaxID=52584 RepID=UPI003004A228